MSYSFTQLKDKKILKYIEKVEEVITKNDSLS